ncbi:MAG TPA: aspartate--tRNA ligase [Candidatus Aminicenantes bacterium]|nr:aspartate--tRNA ligase [Candidatus Aminicenantes bacterium]
MDESTKITGREWFCGDLTGSLKERELTLYGWVRTKREMGGVTFVDLRDRSGIVQVVFDESFVDRDLVRRLGREWVLAVTGLVRLRQNPNPRIPTGEVELLARKVGVLAESRVPPFFPDEKTEASNELRFQYRYLDLRRKIHQERFRLRSRVTLAIRNYLDEQGFLEIETPILTKATPEGARDYLVPSRIYKGRMFALPQSPQLFKQLLMVAGFERYFQMARCFRDEDLRADRQPEFTQVDVEMSFMEPEGLFSLVETMMERVFSLIDKPLSLPFPRLTWAEAMDRYGSDKPDLRIPLEIRDFTSPAGTLGSGILDNIIAEGGTVRGLILPQAETFSRKFLDGVQAFVRERGGQGVIWLKPGPEGFKASIKVESNRIETFFDQQQIPENHIVFLLGGKRDEVLSLLGNLRNHLGAGMADPEQQSFLWVTDFPLFFHNEEENRLDSHHHPFTAPRESDIPRLKSEPLSVLSVAYDLVLNGVEIGGGSRRIHDAGLQREVLHLLGLSDKEIEEKFGFFVNALQYGAPPHLGIALGLDRILMLMTGAASIRDLIAFPKTTSSLCLLTGSPSTVPDKLLHDLGLRLDKSRA